MMQGESHFVIVALSALLDEQHFALCNGDFAILPSICVRMETLLSALGSAQGQRRQDLEALRRQADAGQKTLDASRRGLNSARTRLRAILEVGTQLNTYDGRGRMASVSVGQITMERRK